MSERSPCGGGVCCETDPPWLEGWFMSSTPQGDSCQLRLEPWGYVLVALAAFLAAALLCLAVLLGRRCRLCCCPPCCLGAAAGVGAPPARASGGRVRGGRGPPVPLVGWATAAPRPSRSLDGFHALVADYSPANHDQGCRVGDYTSWVASLAPDTAAALLRHGELRERHEESLRRGRARHVARILGHRLLPPWASSEAFTPLGEHEGRAGGSKGAGGPEVSTVTVHAAADGKDARAADATASPGRGPRLFRWWRGSGAAASGAEGRRPEPEPDKDKAVDVEAQARGATEEGPKEPNEKQQGAGLEGEQVEGSGGDASPRRRVRWRSPFKLWGRKQSGEVGAGAAAPMAQEESAAGAGGAEDAAGAGEAGAGGQPGEEAARDRPDEGEVAGAAPDGLPPSPTGGPPAKRGWLAFLGRKKAEPVPTAAHTGGDEAKMATAAGRKPWLGSIFGRGGVSSEAAPADEPRDSEANEAETSKKGEAPPSGVQAEGAAAAAAAAGASPPARRKWLAGLWPFRRDAEGRGEAEREGKEGEEADTALEGGSGPGAGPILSPFETVQGEHGDGGGPSGEAAPRTPGSEGSSKTESYQTGVRGEGGGSEGSGPRLSGSDGGEAEAHSVHQQVSAAAQGQAAGGSGAAPGPARSGHATEEESDPFSDVEEVLDEELPAQKGNDSR